MPLIPSRQEAHPMADTARPAEPAKKAQDSTTRASQAAIDTATKTAKETVSETEQMTQQVADKVHDIGQTVAGTVAETASAAAEISSKVADQGREAMMLGVRTAADVSGRIADIGFGRGHHLMTSAVQAMDVYRDAAERSADHFQALVTSCLTVGRGIQQIQHTWLELLDQSMGNSARKPQDLLRCSNVVELAEVQRDLYLEAVHSMFETSSRLLEMAARTAQDAVRPLQSSRH
jgi:hypothetical protein